VRSLRSVALAALAAAAFGLGPQAARGEPTPTLYATKSTPIYADADGIHVIGSLTPGTPVTAAGTGGSRLQAFEIDGWSQDGDETTVVAAAGRRIVYVRLTSAPNAHRKVLEQTKDDYDNLWDKVTLAGFIDPAALTADQSAVWAPAQRLYSQRCSNCHALHSTAEFTANQWPAILKTMAKNAALTPAEAALLTQFVQTHAKPE
jgi:trimethylamine-N-oxide reductase cytochrome c-type subunit TorC